MLTRRHLVVSVLSLSAAACGAPREPQFTTRTIVETDFLKGGRGVALLGIEAQHAPPESGSLKNTYYLLSIVEKGKRFPHHQAVVNHHYFGGEIAWTSAQDSAGTPLNFQAFSGKALTCVTHGCFLLEVFGAIVPDDALRAKQNKGYSVSFGSRAGRIMRVTLSPQQIRAQLLAYDATHI